MIKFLCKKVTKGQICNGTLSKNTFHEYYLRGKFHCIMKKYMIWLGYAAILVCIVNETFIFYYSIELLAIEIIT